MSKQVWQYLTYLINKKNIKNWVLDFLTLQQKLAVLSVEKQTKNHLTLLAL